MSFPLPPPIVFDLSVDDQTNARNAYLSEEVDSTGGTVATTLVFASAILQTIAPSIRLYRRHGEDPAGWVLLIVALSLVAIITTVWLLRSRRAHPLARPQIATIVAFETTGLSIERTNRRGTRTTRMLPFDRIRKVRLLPSAIVISSSWHPLLVIPRASLPSDGAELMSFLDDRLTGKRMLVRLPSSRRADAGMSATQ
jgi:hypothetical protein